MGDLSCSGELIPYTNNNKELNSCGDPTLGVRYRGRQKTTPSLLSETYSDESCCEAVIEYVSDPEGKEQIPVFVTRQGNKVYIPPSIADLLRDKPPEQCSGGSEGEDEELAETGRGGAGGGRRHRQQQRQVLYDCDIEGDSDFSVDSEVRIGMERGRGAKGVVEGEGEEEEESEELGAIRIVKTMRKISEGSIDFFDSDLLSSLWEQVKLVGLKLLPFAKTVGLYFLVFLPEEEPSLGAMVLKCLPILALKLFVVLNGIGLGEHHKFSRRILAGLLFSCVGDAFLIWPDYFLHGMAAFGVAQYFYIRAFGFSPLCLRTGLAVYITTGSSLLLILPTLLTQPVPLLVGVLFYSFLLTTMVWRAIARLISAPCSVGLSSGWWSRASGCIGAVVFAVSDTVLALNQFYTPVPYHQTIIMSTYYLAQLMIALSVVTSDQVDQPHTGQGRGSADLHLKPHPLHHSVEGGGGVNGASNSASASVRQRKTQIVI